jgi:hypothetical protein
MTTGSGARSVNEYMPEPFPLSSRTGQQASLVHHAVQDIRAKPADAVFEQPGQCIVPATPLVVFD